MVKLEHTRIENNYIICDVFVEDCKTPIKVSFEKTSGNFMSDNLPPGYEWCRTHLAYAKRALKEMSESEEIKGRLTIMWG